MGSLSLRTGLLLKDDIILRLIQSSSGDRAFDYVSQLALWDRDQASEGYTRAAERVIEKAREFGLSQITTERFPCDGKIEYFGQVIDPQWMVKKGELWLTSPFMMRLASYDDLPMSLAFASVSSDVEAELMDIGPGIEDSDYAAGVKGKIVLTTGRPSVVYERAIIKEGAAGIISSWSVPDFDSLNRRSGDFPDQVGWTRIPLQKSGDSGHFAFLISSRQAQDLRALMQQGKPLIVHAVVDAKTGPGNLEVVSGIIPGSGYPDEEIIVTAHLDHYKPGANDNASGSASVLEMAGTMMELIGKKVLPPPLRTIRFMWVPEYNGTYAWLATHINDPVKRIANLNFDMVGENTVKTNSILSLNYTSDSNPSFLNSIMESIVDFVNSNNSERYPHQMDLYIGSVKGSRNRLECRMAPYNTGTDHELFNNLKIGAATLGSWPDNFYHSSEDTPDKVDPTQLHRAVVIGLAEITTLGYADNEQAGDLARLSLIYGRKRIADSEFSAVKSLLTASSVKRLEEVAVLRADELSTTRIKQSLTEAEKRVMKLIPVPNKGKELSNLSYVSRILALDSAARIPEITAIMENLTRNLREQGESELRVFSIPDAPAFYADGKRSILEIRDSFTAEYELISIEALELYFRAFEKAGAMQILKK